MYIYIVIYIYIYIEQVVWTGHSNQSFELASRRRLGPLERGRSAAQDCGARLPQMNGAAGDWFG